MNYCSKSICNKFLLVIVLACMLTGCGPSSESSSANTAAVPTYTVIDGYLSAAEVYVISPSSNLETFIGETDTKGQIQIPAEYKDYAVLAKIVAGQTTDSDRAGFVAKSYEMRSAAGSTVVTPFTTLAYMNQISLADLALVLRLDEADVAGDYVHTDGKAYLVARTLAAQLDADSDNDDAGVYALQTLTSTAVSYINNFLPIMGDDLNKIELNFDTDDNAFTFQTRVASVKDFIQTDSYITSFNLAHFNREGILAASFSDNQMTLGMDADESTAEFTIDNNKIITAGGSDEFIYVDNALALVLSSENGLVVWSKVAVATTRFHKDELDGKTWHYVGDDSTTKVTKIVSAALTFSQSKDEVTIDTDKNEAVTVPYTVDADGLYSIRLPDSITETSITLRLRKMTGNKVLIVVVDNVGKPAFLAADKKFADSIVKKWTTASGE